jgi:hypothetical protein
LEAAQVAKLDVTAVSGTTPSLTVVVEESANGSTGWATKASFTARTTTGSQIIALPRLNHAFLRATWTISGTTPSFTFSVQVANGDSACCERPAGARPRLLDEAARERDTLTTRRPGGRRGVHQLRRRLERAEDQYRRLDERHAELEQRTQKRRATAEQSRRAMLDHAART